ncbi:hypothetical protein [Pseudoalteromonas sp. Of7M-16]|uniref:hypothetical protein n=1 Tax=Pseudoalteromonas sp. Of7M-16 TaxID=2917756 RepID=UPI001EF589BE|nr:hypothetical protein [Pseudoalteromonas sp. Of7M-16]MCG7548182.1 hypothetical protein [Pseudoalteromonas sp. Of7M-16]
MFNTIKKYVMYGCFILSMPTNAHLMVADHGTLNFDETGAYLVISLASSNFPEADLDNNGHLSFHEFKQAKDSIFTKTLGGVYMQQADKIKQIDGLMLSPQASHHGDGTDIDQIVVMGKFINIDHTQGLSFHNTLYGNGVHTKLEMTAKYKRLGLKQGFELTPKQQYAKVF